VVVFNAWRGRAPTAPVEDLEPLAAPADLPPSTGDRRDLEAAEAALRSSDAEVASVTQSFTPDISVFANLGGSQRDPEATAAMGQFQPNTLVGVKFTANLDYVLYRQVLAGARQAQGYGQAQVEDKKLQIAEDWAQLQDTFAGVKERLALARELETLQKEKADREKARYEDGRTTEFQVLRFADDYNLSRVQTLQLTAQANELEAEARYYNGDDQPW
jgi:outer membrane protein TolC